VIRPIAHRLVGALTATAVALLVVVPSSAPAPALAAPASLGITLVRQELALTPDGDLVLSVRLDQALPVGATFVVTSYRPLKTRADLADAIAGKLPRSVDTYHSKRSLSTTMSSRALSPLKHRGERAEHCNSTNRVCFP
jgi:hypothetical protein